MQIRAEEKDNFVNVLSKRTKQNVFPKIIISSFKK